MKHFLVYVLACLLAVAPACSVLTPQQRAAAKEQIESEYLSGNITQAQRDAAIEALDNDAPVDWETLGIVGVNLIMALVGGPLIVRRIRGPATQKVGLPASKVFPS